MFRIILILLLTTTVSCADSAITVTKSNEKFLEIKNPKFVAPPQDWIIITDDKIKMTIQCKVFDENIGTKEIPLPYRCKEIGEIVRQPKENQRQERVQLYMLPRIVVNEKDGSSFIKEILCYDKNGKTKCFDGEDWSEHDWDYPLKEFDSWKILDFNDDFQSCTNDCASSIGESENWEVK